MSNSEKKKSEEFYIDEFGVRTRKDSSFRPRIVEPEFREKDYFRRWYYRNREKLSEKRKARYRASPYFREKNRIFKANHARKKWEAARKEIEGKVGASVYTIKEVENMTGASAARLSLLTARKFLPKPIIYCRIRWYTFIQVDLIKEVNKAVVAYDVAKTPKTREVLKEVREKAGKEWWNGCKGEW